MLDLARWDAALYGDRPLNAASREQMSAPVKLANGSSYPYGLGWHLEELHGHRLVYHDGNRQDGSTVMARYVDDKLTVIVLTNRGNANPTRIARQVAGLFVPALAAADRPIADQEPQVTALIKTVLLKIQGGTIGPAPFTPEMWQGFYPAGAQAFQGVLRSFGAFRSISLLTRETKGDVHTYRYKVVLGETSLMIDCTLTKEDKISDLTGSQQ